MLFVPRAFIVLAMSAIIALGSPAQAGVDNAQVEHISLVSANAAAQLVRPENIKGDCSEDQISKIRKAVSEAKYLADDAWNYFKGLGEAPGASHANLSRYTLWFGAYSAERYKRVYNMFNAIGSFYNMDNWEYHCDPRDTCGVLQQFFMFAACNPGDPQSFSVIHLCKAFWRASDKTRAATIIHEATHYSEKFYSGKHSENLVLAVQGTNAKGSPYAKEVYGPKDCAQLALDKPDYAVNNADNYNYFVEFPNGCPQSGCIVS